MKLRVTLVTAALAAAALVGTVLPAHSPNAAADPPPAGNVAGTKPYNLYTHGFLSSPIVGYRATDRGPVHRIGGNPIGGMGVWPKTASPDGKFLAVASIAPSVLKIFAIDPAGRLHLRHTSPMPGISVGLEFAPDSKTFYLVTGVSGAQVQAYRLGANGVPHPIGRPTAMGLPVDGLGTPMVTPNGKSLLVGSYFLQQLVRFDIRPDGTVSPARQRLATRGSGPIFPIVTPNGRHVYLPNETANSVASYNILPSGMIVPTGQPPLSTGLFPHVPAITPDGRFLYVPNLGSTFISVFAIQRNGTLRELPKANAGTDALGPMPESASLSPSGKALWTLGQDMKTGNTCILQRFWVQPNGTLVHDKSIYANTGTLVSDGKIITMAPGY